MTVQIENAGLAGARYEPSSSSAPSCRSCTGVPPKSPVPTIAAMIMKQNALMTTI